MQEITVLWTPPQRYEYLAQLDEWTNDRLYAVMGQRGEPRQIEEAIAFYIGTTARFAIERIDDPNHPFRQILARESQRWDVRIRVGAIDVGAGRRLTQSLVGEVEAALIFHHQPSYNVRNTASFTSRPFRILNRTRADAADVPGLLPMVRVG